MTATSYELRAPAQDALSGQRLATAYLVDGCGRALFELRCAMGRAATPEEVRVGLEAAVLLEGVLATWREALRELRAQDDESQTDASS
jgi:hypothetical protein